MPEMDGMECLRRIWQNFTNFSPIMLTASDDMSNDIPTNKNCLKHFSSGIIRKVNMCLGYLLSM
jgi:CheY-like chemotaxis protein